MNNGDCLRKGRQLPADGREKATLSTVQPAALSDVAILQHNLAAFMQFSHTSWCTNYPFKKIKRL